MVATISGSARADWKLLHVRSFWDDLDTWVEPESETVDDKVEELAVGMVFQSRFHSVDVYYVLRYRRSVLCTSCMPGKNVTQTCRSKALNRGRPNTSPG